MKKQRKYRILSLRYSVIDPSLESTSSPTNATVERVFIAQDRKRLLKKLKAFEKRNLSQKKTSMLLRVKRAIEDFSKKCKHFHQEALQL